MLDDSWEINSIESFMLLFDGCLQIPIRHDLVTVVSGVCWLTPVRGKITPTLWASGMQIQISPGNLTIVSACRQRFTSEAQLSYGSIAPFRVDRGLISSSRVVLRPEVGLWFEYHCCYSIGVSSESVYLCQHVESLALTPPTPSCLFALLPF